MRDLLLQCAGILAIVVALIHGILGETKVFPRATIEPPRLRTLIRLVWQASTVAWIGCGVLLIATPWMELRAGAPLDRHHHDLCVRLLRLRQRMGDAWPAFWLDGAECGRGDGGGRLLTPERQGRHSTGAASWKIVFG